MNLLLNCNYNITSCLLYGGHINYNYKKPCFSNTVKSSLILIPLASCLVEKNRNKWTLKRSPKRWSREQGHTLCIYTFAEKERAFTLDYGFKITFLLVLVNPVS